MNDARLRTALPYALGLLIALGLFLLAGQIQYTPRRGQIGPDFWPKLAIGLMALVCLVEIARALATPGAERAHGLAELLDQEGDRKEEASHPRLLLGGVALTFAYAVLMPWLGFLLASFLYLVAFMYLGRYRSHRVIWLAGGLGILLVAVVFLKVVYVSLPRGAPPFDAIMNLF